MFLFEGTQEPYAQVSTACMNGCINMYNTVYSSTLGAYQDTVRDMLWDVTQVIGNAWYGYFLDFWQGVFQVDDVLQAYNWFMQDLYTTEQWYYHQVGEAADDYNQCIGGCTP